MTTREPEQPPQPFGGTEYPSLNYSEAQPDQTPPIDYPTDAGLPPPVYPPPYPTGYPGYPVAPSYYAGGYDPYRPTKPPGTNGMAIAALAVSAASLVLFCGIPSFIGVILGIIAMRETKRTGQDGFGMALAGTIIGAIPTVLWLLYLFVFISISASGWQWAP
jgi:Domain of unknown function (DUF4190)